MKIWLSKNSEIPVREQLVTQIILGIAGGNLPIGEKLPSTREIARRFQVHANTVANAYHKLCELGWLEFKKGSGFYICERNAQNYENTLDKIITKFFQTTQQQGFTLAEIKKRLIHHLEFQTTENILVVESDIELQKILIEEIKLMTNLEVSGIKIEDLQPEKETNNSIIAAMFSKKAVLQPLLPPNKTCVFLQTNSVSDSMKGKERPTVEDLIAVVSGWEKFLILAKTVLIAANIDAESLIVRHTGDENWQNGLQNVSMIICDTLTARNFPNDDRIRTFSLISEHSLKELKDKF